MSDRAPDWTSFWDRPNSIYVNARHREAHYRRVASDMLRYVPQGGTVLDYGCGEALSAQLVADKAGRLTLCESAPNLRAMLSRRSAGNPKIAVCAPDDLKAMPAHAYDLVVMHSVAQYLTAAELAVLLKSFHRLLKPHGMLVLGDVIPPDISAATDALALLRFAAHEGFFLAAVAGLVRTLFSDYWRLRSKLGLSRYSEPAIVEILQASGFTPQRASDNIGHNAARMTFLCRPT